MIGLRTPPPTPPPQARDNGSPMMNNSAQVIIIVQDFNDEPPTFDLPLYAVDVCQTGMSGTSLVKPVAVDRDSGVNAELSYNLQVRGKP